MAFYHQINIAVNYGKIYQQLIDRARSRTISDYTETHHVIPRCMGGSDDVNNLVELTPEEHFVDNVLIVKIYPRDYNLINAVQMMTVGHVDKRPNRKLYGWLRRKFSERMSLLSTGSGNSQYGTRWVNDGIKSIKLIVGEELPPGFVEGRIMRPKEIYYCGCGNVKSRRSRVCKTCDLNRGNKKFTEQEIIDAYHKSVSKTITNIAEIMGVGTPSTNSFQRRRIRQTIEKYSEIC